MQNTVLMIDDSVMLHSLAEACLSASGFECHFAADGEAGYRRVVELRPSIILLDLDLPGADGWETYRRLRQHPAACTVPILILSADSAVASRQRALDMGAADYLVKPIAMPLVAERVRAALGRVRQAHEAAGVDPLTKMKSRTQIASDLAARNTGERRSWSAAMVDLDELGLLNTRHGRHVGDAVIVELVQRVKIAVQEDDEIYAMGGGTLLIVSSRSDRQAMARLAEDVVRSVGSSPFRTVGLSLACTCCCGVVSDGVCTVIELTERAQQTLLRAKLKGPTSVVVARKSSRQAAA